LSKLLSIITVTYNCAELIRPTLDSILKSKPDGLEYIVIDGKSTDGTVDIIQSFGNDIDLIVSEPDSGIYDAMNKGLRAATGEYVLFINAGDLLYTNNVFPALADHVGQSNSDIYFGDTMLMDNSGRELGLRSIESSRALPEELNWKSLERGMVVSHQSFIVKRSIAPLYQLKYQSSSDIDWVISCLKMAESVVNLQMVISGYLVGGYSKQTHSSSLKERFAILSHHYGMTKTVLNHFIILLRAVVFKIRGKTLN